MMSKKDYEVIAAVIKNVREYALDDGKDKSPANLAIMLTGAMSDALEAQNPRFNRQTFGVACMPRQLRP